MSSIYRTPLSQPAHKEHANIKYLQEVLQESGISLRFDAQPHILTKEPAQIKRDIEKQLKTHILHPDNIKQFIDEFKLLCAKQDFTKVLEPTSLRKLDSASDLTACVQQECLFRLFLTVDCLQEPLIDMLLDAIADVIADAAENTANLRLYLNPLRFLPYATEPIALTTRLLDLIDVAPLPSQVEILAVLPEVLPDVQHERTASELIKLLATHSQLVAALVECLNSLCLTTATRAHIKELLMRDMTHLAHTHFLPVLIEFLLDECDHAMLARVLRSVRDAFDDLLMRTTMDTHKLLMFVAVQRLMVRERRIADTWLTLIASLATSDCKPIDVLICVLVHATDPGKKRQVETLVRKRVRSAAFKIDALQTLFKHVAAEMVRKTYRCMLEMGGALVAAANEKSAHDYAIVWYQLMFAHAQMEFFERQEMLADLIGQITSSNQKAIGRILRVIGALSAHLLKLHVAQLMVLLDRFPLMDLKEVKAAVDIICRLICGEHSHESTAPFKDELHMLIRKQLASTTKLIKNRAIVCAVAMVAHTVSGVELLLADTTANSNNTDDTIAIDDLPTERARDAAHLVTLVHACAAHCIDSIGLYYDHVSSMLLTHPHIDRHFILWLYHTVTSEFQTTFVTEHAHAQTVADVALTAQFALNEASEVETDIVLNIGHLTLHNDRNMLILAPLFRFMRLLHFYHHDGDLASIDALLGCAILMPALDDLTMYEGDQLAAVLRCVFHMINWLRELISAFVTQKSRKLRMRVLQRLRTLIELERALEGGMRDVPGMQLPESYFDVSVASSTTATTASSPPKRGVKRKNADGDASTVGTQARKGPAKKKEGGRGAGPAIAYREMDTDVMLLIKYPLKINENTVVTSTQASTLNLNQFEFLLRDFVGKLKGLSGVTVFARTESIEPLNLIKDCVTFMPYIKRNLDAIVAELDTLIRDADGCYDSPHLLTDDVNDLKRAFDAIIQYFAHLCAWSGFQQTTNISLLRDCLAPLIPSEQSQLLSSKRLIGEFSVVLKELSTRCLLLATATHVVSALRGLYTAHAQPDLQKRMAVISEALLSRKWFDKSGSEESGKAYTENVDLLIRTYTCGLTTKTVYNLICVLQTDVATLRTRTDHLPTLVTITKQNFYLLYRHVCAALVESLQREIGALTNREHLNLWRTVALSMQGLLSIVRQAETRANFTSFLRKSVRILKVFLAQGMPIVEMMLRSKPQEVVEILKVMQTSTRFLHHLCCHSKVTKEASLVAHVPQFRLTLESLVYRVKAALVANNCSAAFWMGTLKNKDIHGEDILSQSTFSNSETNNTDVTDEGGESDEELISDDEDVVDDSSLSDVV